MTRATTWICAGVALWQATVVNAQSLGTFRWQLLPYCNVVAVTVTQTGGVYRLEGTDDQCGGGRDLAAVQGLAFPNPDGTIGFGLTIVTAPGGVPVHVDADIAITTVSGAWRDSTGASGTFAFTPGAGTGGNPRPPAPPAIPPAFQLAPTGSLLAAGTLGMGTAPASGSGVRMMWYPGKAAIRAGRAHLNRWDDAMTGEFSTAFGNATQASGTNSTALGTSTLATAESSTAMGSTTLASGAVSTAMGLSTTASGDYSTAMGDSTIASGRASVAAGSSSQATGHFSVALGREASANGERSFALGRGFTTGGAFGSFVFGDASSPAQQVAFAPNTFIVRAAGGARFFSHGTSDLGPVLLASGTDWIAASDVNLKHRFRDLDGEDVLGRIAKMPVAEWSYKAQDPAVRHIGPTAQDFYAAFGLGQDPLRISPLDSGGVALASVRALEARTRALPARATALETENAVLHLRLTAAATEVASLRERLERLERMQALRPEGVVAQERR